MLPFSRRGPIVVLVFLCCAVFALARLGAIGRAWGEPSATAMPEPAAGEMLAGVLTPTPTPLVSPTPGLTTVQFSSSTYIDDESHTATVTVTRTFPMFLMSTVEYATSDGTATGGASCSVNVDYVTASGKLTFAPNVASQTFTVALCPDHITEPDETLDVALSNPVAATLGQPDTALVTINDTATQFVNPTDIVMSALSPADPYPSTITVAGGPAVIASMRVTLYDYSCDHGLTTVVMLVSPGGVRFIVMAGPAGSPPINMPVTLNLTDTAGQVMPANAPLATADYEPTTWVPITGYPPPAPPPPYNIPGHDVGGTGTQTFLGNFGGTNANGVWSLYVRDIPPPPMRPDTPQVISGHFAGGWGIEFLGPTAAQASLSGRVITASGAGIRNARVVVSGNSLPRPRVVTTGSFGYFSFEGLTVGETYVATVNSQRYTFTAPSRVITLVDNITDCDFVADP